MKTVWTHFHDMSSGGSTKLQWKHIWMQAPEEEARRAFYAKFGRNPDCITCTCCGADYSVSAEHETLEQATAFERGCRYVPAKKGPDGRYILPDPNAGYIEDDESPPEGYAVSGMPRWGKYQTLAEFLRRPDILIVRAEDIGADERKVDVPQQGYVWVGQ